MRASKLVLKRQSKAGLHISVEYVHQEPSGTPSGQTAATLGQCTGLSPPQPSSLSQGEAACSWCQTAFLSLDLRFNKYLHLASGANI